MAPGRSHPYCSLYRNFSPNDLVKDKLAKDPGPVKGSHSGSNSPASSRHPIPGPTLDPTLYPTLAPTPAITNKLFKKSKKAYLELNQRPKQPPAKRERFLKTKISELYYDKLHMDCYHFYQQYEDDFETAGAIEANQTLFATSFLCRNISVCRT